MNYNYKKLYKLRYVLFVYLGLIIRDSIFPFLGLQDGTVMSTIYMLGTSSILAYISFLLVGTTKITKTKIKFNEISNILFKILVLSFFVLSFFFLEKLYDLKEIMTGGAKLVFVAGGVALSAGILEEFLIRVLAFTIFLDFFKNSKNKFLLAGFSSSFVFGLMHLNNLPEQTLTATLQQVFYATALGLVFAAIRVWTNGICIAILLHAFFDFQPMIAVGGATEDTWGSTILLFLPIAIVSIICLISFDRDSSNILLLSNKMATD